MEERIPKRLIAFVINRVKRMEREQRKFFAKTQQVKSQDDLMTVKEISEQFGISSKTIYRWRDNGLIHLQNGPGGKLLIKRENLENYLKTNSYGGCI